MCLSEELQQHTCTRTCPHQASTYSHAGGGTRTREHTHVCTQSPREAAGPGAAGRWVGGGSYFWGPGRCDVPAFPKTCLQVDGSEAVTVLGLFCRKGHGRSVCVYYVRRDLGAAGEGRFWPLFLALISARPREGGPAPGPPNAPRWLQTIYGPNDSTAQNPTVRRVFQRSHSLDPSQQNPSVRVLHRKSAARECHPKLGAQIATCVRVHFNHSP